LETSEMTASNGDDRSKPLAKPNLNPQQFAISELFWVLLLVALTLAVLTPSMRHLPQRAFNTVLALLGIQAMAFLVVVYLETRQRKRLLEKSGNLIAVGSSLQPRSNAKAVALRWILLLAPIFIQFSLTFMLIWQSTRKDIGPQELLFKVLYSVLFISSFKWSVRFIRWGLYPGTIEFFENGVVQIGILIPWRKVVLEGTSFKNRIHLLFGVGSKSQTRSTIWIDEAQVDHLLAFATAKRNTKH